MIPVPHPERLLQHESLARYTAARLGGPADWLYVAKESTAELVEVVSTAWKHEIPMRVLGGGANVLVPDKGVRGLVVINDVTEITFGDWHDGRNVSAAGGTGLTILARKCASRGLSGLEWMASVPGTVGGALDRRGGSGRRQRRANLDSRRFALRLSRIGFESPQESRFSGAVGAVWP
jgi:UDP-N-acetylmuramate dehydrogenase